MKGLIASTHVDVGFKEQSWMYGWLSSVYSHVIYAIVMYNIDSSYTIIFMV